MSEWGTPENLRLGETAELIREIDEELGAPTGKKKADWRPERHVDLAAHMDRKQEWDRVKNSLQTLTLSACYAPGHKWLVTDHDDIRFVSQDPV